MNFNEGDRVIIKKGGKAGVCIKYRLRGLLDVWAWQVRFDDGTKGWFEEKDLKNDY